MSRRPDGQSSRSGHGGKARQGLSRCLRPYFAPLWALVLLACLATSGLTETRTWRIGVLASEGVERCLANWRPTAVYLESRLPDWRFAIVPLIFDEVRPAVESAAVDFLIVNPQKYAVYEFAGRAMPLATRSFSAPGGRLSVYGGVLFERAGPDAGRNLERLRGKRLAAVDPESLGGYLAVAGMLSWAGLDSERLFSRIDFTATHSQVVQAVLEGRADAGAVRTGVLEGMLADGRLKPGELAVYAAPQSDADEPFPFVRSTQLYPEWPFARLAHVPMDKARLVLAALLDMPPESEAARAADMAGWELARPYSPLVELMAQLKMAPFDDLVQVSLTEAASQHPWTAFSLLAALAALAGMTFFLTRMNARLKLYRSKLEDELARSRIANDSLRFSETRLSQIFEGSAGGMRVIGTDGIVLRVNEAFLELSGFSRDELEGRSCSEAFGGPLCDTADCTLRRILAGEPRFELEVDKTRKDGSVVTCALTATPYHALDGTLMGVIEDFRDVTETKRADLARTEIERQHRTIFENAPLGIGYLDGSGRLLRCNAQLRRILGIAESEGEAACRLVRPPESILPALARALGGRQEVFEGAVELSDGRPAVLRVHLNPVSVPGCAPEMVIATVEDVTRTRQKDAELVNLWKAVEYSQASILVTDASGAICYVNPYFTDTTGYTQSEVLGLNPRLLKSGLHDEAFYRDMWDTLLANRTWRGELANKKKNGEIYWEDATISPVQDENGKIVRFIAVKEDVTERKRSESELRKALTEFEIIFNNTAIAVVLLKGNRIINRVNRRFCELFGYLEDELVGQSMNMVHLDQSTADQFARGYYPQLKDDKVVRLEHRYRRRDGGVLWCLVSGKALDPNDLESGILWAFDDITARRELERTREDVERIMRHDLKAPLNGIINLPDLIAEEGGLNDSQLEMLAYIAQAGRRMLRQVNESLNLYKMETGTFVYRPSRLDLWSVLDRVLRDLGGLMLRREVSVSVTRGGSRPITQEPLPVFGQDDLCYSMIANIVKNAVEASDKGQTVRIDLSVSTDLTVLTVRNARAVPPDVAPYFFEKYSTSGKPGGTGLGTYSARLMAAAQGGSIEMFTAESEGTVVTIRLPLVRASGIPPA